MAIRTEESLKKLFAESRARQEKRKQEEQLKYKKASQSVKKALADKLSIKQEKTSQKTQEQPQIEFSRIITIYNSRYIERFIGEDDLYTTREELENAEPNNINWRLWDSIVNKTRKELNIK
jgi:hypothetical protein